ncbi:MAG: hypothetical protein JO048_17500 [Methylobacteriaceae bacterium]|nr:hypothetical protein [Methylobacteriaceae bacterium]
MRLLAIAIAVTFALIGAGFAFAGSNRPARPVGAAGVTPAEAATGLVASDRS